MSAADFCYDTPARSLNKAISIIVRLDASQIKSSIASKVSYDTRLSAMIAKNMHKKIDAIALLEADWDSYGAPAMSPSVLRAARQLIDDLYTQDRPSIGALIEPEVMTGGDGSIGLHWHGRGPDCDLEVIVAPGGIEYVGTISGRVIDGGIRSAEDVLQQLGNIGLR